MNYIVFSVVYLLIFVISAWVYHKHYDRLVLKHPFTRWVDVMVWIGGAFSLLVVFVFYDRAPEFNALLWALFLFASASINIHIVRFYLSLSRRGG